MPKAIITQQKNNPIGDAAVDGLLAGLFAGAGMGLTLLILGLLTGNTVGGILGSFSPTGPVSPLVGTLSHLATSAIYGALFGLLVLFLRGRAPLWGAGLVYGVVLFLLGWWILLPGTESPLLRLPSLHFFISHLIFGLLLGLTFQQKKSVLHNSPPRKNFKR